MTAVLKASISPLALADIDGAGQRSGKGFSHQGKARTEDVLPSCTQRTNAACTQHRPGSRGQETQWAHGTPRVDVRAGSWSPRPCARPHRSVSRALLTAELC